MLNLVFSSATGLILSLAPELDTRKFEIPGCSAIRKLRSVP